MNNLNRQCLFHNLPSVKCPTSSSGLCSAQSFHIASKNFQDILHPFTTDSAFGIYQPLLTIQQVIPVFSSRLLPAFPGRNFITTTDSSATSHHIRHTWISPCNAVILKRTRNGIRLPRLRRIPCEQCHPQSQYKTDQVLGFALFCTLTLLHCRIRFTYAMYCSLPIASFRPHRYQQRPCNSDCLPPDRGDTGIPPAGFARHAGQTKNHGAESSCPVI